MRVLRNLFLGLLFIGVILALVAAGGIWWVNQYVHSVEFSDKVKAQAGKLAGVPVNFKSINWDMMKGLTIDGLEMRNEVPNEQPGILQVKEVRLRYNWKALLNRHFEITEFDLVEPALLLGQQPNGGYRLPVVIAAENKEARAENQQAAEQPPGEKQPALVLVVHEVKIEKGHLEIKYADGSYSLLCLEINGNAIDTNSSSENLSLQGTLNIAEAQFASKVKVTAVHTPFSYKNGVLNFSAIEASAYKGKVNGTFEGNLFDPKISYTLKLDVQDCDVNDLLGSAFQKPGVVSGKLDAKTLWLGTASDPLGVSGKGSLEVRNGQVINLPAFKNLAQMLGGISAIAQPDFSECKMEYTVGDQTMNVQTLVLKSALFDLTGSGKIKFDSSLDMPLQAGLNPEIARQVPQIVGNFLTQRADGYTVIPFTVTGTVAEPKVDLAIKQENMVNGAAGLIQQFIKPNNDTQQPNANNNNSSVLKQAQGALQNLFGAKKNEPPQQAAVTPAQPAPQPSAQDPVPAAQP
jgi:AsmA-like C-terminal region